MCVCGGSWWVGLRKSAILNYWKLRLSFLVSEPTWSYMSPLWLLLLKVHVQLLVSMHFKSWSQHTSQVHSDNLRVCNRIFNTITDWQKRAFLENHLKLQMVQSRIWFTLFKMFFGTLMGTTAPLWNVLAQFLTSSLSLWGITHQRNRNTEYDAMCLFPVISWVLMPNSCLGIFKLPFGLDLNRSLFKQKWSSLPKAWSSILTTWAQREFKLVLSMLQVNQREWLQMLWLSSMFPHITWCHLSFPRSLLLFLCCWC